jgi:hypothetical protein
MASNCSCHFSSNAKQGVLLAYPSNAGNARDLASICQQLLLTAAAAATAFRDGGLAERT